MKLVLALVAISLFAFVYGEPCTGNNHHECHEVHPITHCHNHTHVLCIEGQCECSYNAPGATACTSKADCAGSNCRDQHDSHCIDGSCRCSQPHQGGPGGPGGAGQG